MKILYTTNPNAEDINEIPNFIRSFGDEVVVKTQRFELEYLKDEKIDFIVSDKTQFIFNEDIIKYLPRRVINLHPSFLPFGRGYYPNFFAIIKEFPLGVTIHFIDEGIDSGEILAQTRIHCSPDDTFKDSYNRLRKLMATLFKTLWPDLRVSKLSGIEQNLELGNLFYKRDFENYRDSLINGWDTKISEYVEKNVSS